MYEKNLYELREMLFFMKFCHFGTKNKQGAIFVINFAQRNGRCPIFKSLNLKS